MSEALLLMAEGYEKIAEGMRKLAAGDQTEEKPKEKKNPAPEKKEEPEAPKMDLKTVRAFLTEKSRAGKTSEVKNLISQFGFGKLSEVPEEKLPELYEKAKAL